MLQTGTLKWKIKCIKQLLSYAIFLITVSYDQSVWSQQALQGNFISSITTSDYSSTNIKSQMSCHWQQWGWIIQPSVYRTWHLTIVINLSFSSKKSLDGHTWNIYGLAVAPNRLKSDAHQSCMWHSPQMRMIKFHIAMLFKLGITHVLRFWSVNPSGTAPWIILCMCPANEGRRNVVTHWLGAYTKWSL